MKPSKWIIAGAFSVYSLIFLTGNALGEEPKNLATDYRPLFSMKAFPNLYNPKTEEQKLEKLLLEQSAKEKMKFGNINGDRGNFILTYPVFELRF